MAKEIKIDVRLRIPEIEEWNPETVSTMMKTVGDYMKEMGNHITKEEHKGAYEGMVKTGGFYFGITDTTTKDLKRNIKLENN